MVSRRWERQQAKNHRGKTVSVNTLPFMFAHNADVHAFRIKLTLLRHAL